MRAANWARLPRPPKLKYPPGPESPTGPTSQISVDGYCKHLRFMLGCWHERYPIQTPHAILPLLQGQIQAHPSGPAILQTGPPQVILEVRRIALRQNERAVNEGRSQDDAGSDLGISTDYGSE